MDQPELQGDETILVALHQLEQNPMPKTPTPIKPVSSSKRNVWLLGFVAVALILSAYLFLSLRNTERLTDQEEQILRAGKTQQFDESLFRK